MDNSYSSPAGGFWRNTLVVISLVGLLLTGCDKKPVPVKQPDAAVPIKSEYSPKPIPVPSPTPHAEPYSVEQVASVPLFVPPSTGQKINHAAWVLICEAEVGTTKESYYSTHKIRFPEWPGGNSGVTWGIGFDSGYNSRNGILLAWKKISAVDRLASCAGIKGSEARSKLTTVNDILIPWNVAVEVFDTTTVPRFYQEMLSAFPTADQLHINCQGALTSMVYNRGSSLVGATRIDLRTIARAVPKKDYKAIADALRHMNVTMGDRWRSQGVYNGLSSRRNSEADMVESCIQ